MKYLFIHVDHKPPQTVFPKTTFVHDFPNLKNNLTAKLEEEYNKSTSIISCIWQIQQKI